MHSVPPIVNRTASAVSLTSNVLSSVAEGDFAGMRAPESLELSMGMSADYVQVIAK